MGDRASNSIIIENKSGWQPINWFELWRYRDLLFILIYRDIKAKYAQSILGIGWAIIQPFFSMIVFTIIFGNLAKISSDGVPYAIFSFTALVPWTYFSGALSSSSSSLLSSTGMMTKVYFPRLVIPVYPVLSKLVDFMISFIILLVLMAYFNFQLTIEIIYLPIFLIVMIFTATGMGMWITALSVQFRDINYGKNFFFQLLLYCAPVVYPASSIPEQYRIFYGIFPMTGVIEGFRSVLLKTNPIPWDYIGTGIVTSSFLLISGAFYFKRMERNFVDVI